MKKQSLSISENTSPTAEQQENLPEKGQNHSKIYKKLIIHTVIAVILGILMITHDSEVLTASEKFMIFTCTFFCGVLTGSEPLMKEWIQKESTKNSQYFLKTAISELWAVICSFALISTILLGIRASLHLIKEKYSSYDSYKWVFSDSVFDNTIPKSWLIGNTPATIAGCLSSLQESVIFLPEGIEDNSNTSMNKTVTTNSIQDSFSSENSNTFRISESLAQKIADFLNTPVKSPLIRFFLKWFPCILALSIIICFCEKIGLPMFIRTHYFPVLIGAINIGTLIGGIFIFPISLIYILVAFSFVTYIAGFLLCLWGIFLPVIIILNFIISSFLFLFEKIKEMFTKEKKEISAL